MERNGNPESIDLLFSMYHFLVLTLSPFPCIFQLSFFLISQRILSSKSPFSGKWFLFLLPFSGKWFLFLLPFSGKWFLFLLPFSGKWFLFFIHSAQRNQIHFRFDRCNSSTVSPFEFEIRSSGNLIIIMRDEGE